MGSIITLGLGKMDIDWGKNDSFRDYSALFQKTDVKRIYYTYCDDRDGDKIIHVRREGYSKPLKAVKKRLDLLGYSINEIREKFEEYDISYYGTMSFDEFYEAIKKINVRNIDMYGTEEEVYKEGLYDPGEYAEKYVIGKKIIDVPAGISFMEKKRLENYLEEIDPLITLRILAENKANFKYNVKWYFRDAIDGGWVKKEDIVRDLDQENRILIVTEGSSDTYILQKTMKSLCPDTFDFFYFIDMEENYPFTGVGNLYNFCTGLSKIGVINKSIFLFDNDTAGTSKYYQAKKLDLPHNLCVLKLPNLKEFEDFDTIGPTGTAKENINGKAVSIECFLDFSCVPGEPQVRWTSYDASMDQYQGSLINKSEYTKSFFKGFNKANGYNTSKLEELLTHMISEWVLSR